MPEASATISLQTRVERAGIEPATSGLQSQANAKGGGELDQALGELKKLGYIKGS